MLIQVPRGKTVYVGAFRFVEGEILPPHIAIHFPDELEPEIIETMAPEPIEEKPKRQYIRKPKPEIPQPSQGIVIHEGDIPDGPDVK